jgi:hypothetical protein
MTEGLRVNLMCANRPIPGYVNLDMQDLPGVDMIYTIDPFHPRLPFQDDSVCEIEWNNGPEHVFNINEMVQELWRVSHDKATWHLLTPGYRDVNSWRDPTHFSHWEERILDFYTATGFDGRRYEPALLEYRLVGDNDHGLEFFVTAVKWGKA